MERDQGEKWKHALESGGGPSNELLISAIKEMAEAQLLEQMIDAHEMGEEWASVILPTEGKDGNRNRGAMVRLSDDMQMGGFQTQEDYPTVDGRTHHKLTVFWGNGKERYVAEQKQAAAPTSQPVEVA